jgi:serine/threonine protein kinase
MIDTALDVARAMAHLHAHNILHSDLKARNVLLRSDMHDPRGFTAKVADFGLSLTIDPHSTHVSNAFQVRDMLAGAVSPACACDVMLC